MPCFANPTALKIIDSVAILIGQAYQLARCRCASASSPVLRMMTHRDLIHREHELLRRETEMLRDQRHGLQPHRRPGYAPEHRLAILQLMRLRGWNVLIAAKRFVLHPNTVRSWLTPAKVSVNWPPVSGWTTRNAERQPDQTPRARPGRSDRVCGVVAGSPTAAEWSVAGATPGSRQPNGVDRRTKLEQERSRCAERSSAIPSFFSKRPACYG